MALLEYVDGAERMYCVLHTHIGAIFLAKWHRPPDDDGSLMNELLASLRHLRSEVVGTVGRLGRYKYSSPKEAATF